MFNPELVFAVAFVREASHLAQRIQAAMGGMNLTKGDFSPVTVADFAIQALAGRALDARFPDDCLVAEERASDLASESTMLEAIGRFLVPMAPEVSAERICAWIDRGGSEPGSRFWTLDPIDGTKGYLRGGQYAVALALVVDGCVELGVLGCPSLDGGTLALARRGHGAWRAPLEGEQPLAPMRVSMVGNPADARLLRSFEKAHTNTERIDRFIALMGIEAAAVGMDSQAKYAVLGAGEGELILRMLSPDKPDYRERIWDQAAGSIVVEEAGGRISDLEGRALDFTAGRTLERNRGIVASNGLLHEAALEALGRMKDEG